MKCSWCNKYFIVAHLNEDSNDRCLGEATISLCIEDLVMQRWYVVALVRQKAALCGTSQWQAKSTSLHELFHLKLVLVGG